MKFPVTIVKGNVEAQVIHPVDLKGWLDLGFKVKGEEVGKKENKKTPKELLIEEAEFAGIELSGKETAKEIEQLLEDAKK